MRLRCAVCSQVVTILCRYFMVGACQKGESCPYSHDRNISRKGTLPCRFFQVGTCANGSNCRFSHSSEPGGPQPEAVSSLTIQMDSFAFDQSEAGSEAGSYDTSLSSFETEAGWGAASAGGYLDPAAGGAGGFYCEPGSLGYWPGAEAGAEADYDPAGGHYEASYSQVAPVSVTLSPQVVVTVLPAPAPPPPQHCCDHKTLATTETNNNNSSNSSSGGKRDPSEPGPTSATPVCDSRPDPPTMIPLTSTRTRAAAGAGWTAPKDWAEAAEFVPKVEEAKPRSWAQVVNTGLTYPGCELSTGEAESQLCPFYKVGECRCGNRQF